MGCDHELGSAAKEDNCGVCGGDGATCRLVRGHYRSQQDSARGKNPRTGPEPACPSQSGHPGLCLLRPGEDTVVVIPYGSRHVRLVLKGPDHLCKSRSVLVATRLEAEQVLVRFRLPEGDPLPANVSESSTASNG